VLAKLSSASSLTQVRQNIQILSLTRTIWATSSSSSLEARLQTKCWEPGGTRRCLL
jgi:hypothetical protein